MKFSWRKYRTSQQILFSLTLFWFRPDASVLTTCIIGSVFLWYFVKGHLSAGCTKVTILMHSANYCINQIYIIWIILPYIITNIQVRWSTFLYSWFRASWLYINKIRLDATVCRCLFIAKLLYMFRVSIAPIVRSTSNCNYSFWYRSYHVSEEQPSAIVA